MKAASTNWVNLEPWVDVESFYSYGLTFAYNANTDVGVNHNWRTVGPTKPAPFLGADKGWRFSMFYFKKYFFGCRNNFVLFCFFKSD